MRQEVPARKLQLEAGIPEDTKLCTARLRAYLQINLAFIQVEYTGTFKKVTHAPCLEVPLHTKVLVHILVNSKAVLRALLKAPSTTDSTNSRKYLYNCCVTTVVFG